MFPAGFNKWSVMVKWDDTACKTHGESHNAILDKTVDVRTLRRLEGEEKIRDAAQRERAARQKAKAEQLVVTLPDIRQKQRVTHVTKAL